MGRSRGTWLHDAQLESSWSMALLNRCIVLSFMSAFAAPRSPTTTSFSGPQHSPTTQSGQYDSSQDVVNSSSPTHAAAPSRDSPPPRTRTERASSIRPMSMVQTYQPPLMEIAQDTIPELQPIFSFLNSHANKLYQEGYFLKLNDLDTRMNLACNNRGLC